MRRDLSRTSDGLLRDVWSGGHFCHREAPDALIPHLVEHLRT